MRQLCFKLFFLLFFFFNASFAKLLIITHAFNRPDFIELQVETFKKFLKDDYEFVVFNDARIKKISNEISKVCKLKKIRCLKIPQEIHDRPYMYRFPGEDYNNPCVRCANVVQYSLDTLGFGHNDLVMIIDSDMFLIDNFSVKDFMDGNVLAGVPQRRGPVNYLWNGLVFFDMTTLPDKKSFSFNCGKYEGHPCDVGGALHYYLKKHVNLKLKYIHGTSLIRNQENVPRKNRHELVNMLFDLGATNCEFYLNYKFFHYRSGGNWDNRSKSYHKHKTSALHRVIDNAFHKIKSD